jgi:hypothetical protein
MISTRTIVPTPMYMAVSSFGDIAWCYPALRILNLEDTHRRVDSPA